jgi:hypothetical protein
MTISYASDKICFSDYIRNGNMYIISSAILGASFLFFACVGILWMKRCNCFPIKERSTMMSLLLLIFGFIFIATEFFPTIYFKLYPNLEYSFSDTYVLINNILMATSYNIFPIIYIFKTARIYYAFETNAKIRVLNAFFRCERYMILVTIVLGFMSSGFI